MRNRLVEVLIFIVAFACIWAIQKKFHLEWPPWFIAMISIFITFVLALFIIIAPALF